tara:strand:+ start:112 stop:921 length:810 start_codon:yes stop_codon:yes gene_type:complete
MQNTTENPWDESAPKEETPRVTKSSKAKKIADEVLNVPAAPVTPAATNVGEYDIDGLMTDFPTATELERFVYDETGIVLQLKGRANKLKYQVAMDVLNGQEVDQKYVGGDNPYIDRTELVPIDPIKEPPARSALLPDRSQVQNVFVSNVVPHPEDEARAQDKKVSMLFRKYNNGMISYEILGPLEQRPYGEKIDKFGRKRPEVIKWVDPRTGEQTIVREDGTMTPQGKRLRAMMQTFKVNRSNQWEVWIDREFVSLNDAVAHNPWDLKA